MQGRKAGRFNYFPDVIGEKLITLNVVVIMALMMSVTRNENDPSRFPLSNDRISITVAARTDMARTRGLVNAPLLGVLFRNLSSANLDSEILITKTIMFETTGENRNCTCLTILARYSNRNISEVTRTDESVVFSTLVAFVVTTNVLNVVDGFRIIGR